MMPANARKASFASRELGNAAATSGSRTTMVLLCAYREAYLLRDAWLKSYSGRISSASSGRPAERLVRIFFIIPLLPFRRPARADDPNPLTSFKRTSRPTSAPWKKEQAARIVALQSNDEDLP